MLFDVHTSFAGKVYLRVTILKVDEKKIEKLSHIQHVTGSEKLYQQYKAIWKLFVDFLKEF